MPPFDFRAHRPTIDGLPLGRSLTYDELRALPRCDRSATSTASRAGASMMCADGVRLQTIIDMVRPASKVRYVFHSLGAIYRDSAQPRAGLPDAMIAYDMDGAPLSPDHGLPLRLVMPRMFGYKGPKWLTRIEFRDLQDIGYWEQRNWKVDGFGSRRSRGGAVAEQTRRRPVRRSDASGALGVGRSVRCPPPERADQLPSECEGGSSSVESGSSRRYVDQRLGAPAAVVVVVLPQLVVTGARRPPRARAVPPR
ncbi:MAG: molybdopterin-dependent oxidoreductase [Dehalococcoidia bacterium]